jgi:hypothetical protein
MTYTRQRRTRRYLRSRARRLPRNRVRPNYLLLFTVFTLAIAAGVGISYVLTTPRLDVKSVAIKGVRLADAKAIQQAASRAVGHNIILTRTGPILEQVRRLSEVKQVRMGRRFPNRMWIRVWEREPEAVLATARGFYLVQRDGLVFHRVNAPPRDVPIIRVAGNERFAPGRTVRCAGAKCALGIIAIARGRAIKLGQISVDPEGDICLNMGSDFCVKLGEPDEIALKMSLLQKMLAHRPSIVREGGYINLVCPSNPAWKPNAAAPAAS